MIKRECPACEERVDIIVSGGRTVLVDPKRVVTYSEKGKRQEGYFAHILSCKAKTKKKKAAAKKSEKAEKPASAETAGSLAAEA